MARPFRRDAFVLAAANVPGRSMMIERIEHEFDQYASNYEAIINDYIGFSGQSQDFYTLAKANHLRKILEAKNNAGKIDVLDVGCGRGLIHSYLEDENFRLIGVDVAEKTIEVARRTNPHVAYDVYDGTRLPYRDASYDVVFTICVLHHIPVEQRRAFVHEARRVLRNGGTFVVFEHNKLNLLVQWVVSRIPLDRNAALLTSWNTQRLLRNAGFHDVACKHILFFPFKGAGFPRIESRLAWLPIGAQYYVAGMK